MLSCPSPSFTSVPSRPVITPPRASEPLDFVTLMVAVSLMVMPWLVDALVPVNFRVPPFSWKLLATADDAPMGQGCPASRRVATVRVPPFTMVAPV